MWTREDATRNNNEVPKAGSSPIVWNLTCTGAYVQWVFLAITSVRWLVLPTYCVGHRYMLVNLMLRESCNMAAQDRAEYGIRSLACATCSRGSISLVWPSQEASISYAETGDNPHRLVLPATSTKKNKCASRYRYTPAAYPAIQ